MKDGKFCRVREVGDGEGKVEFILIGIWKDLSICSRLIGW